MAADEDQDQDPSNPGDQNWRLNWRHVGILYGREFRAAIRDKSIVINSILIPVFLYPFLLWAGLSVLTFIRGQSEATVCKVAVYGLPADHPRLRRVLERNENLAITELKHPEPNKLSKIRAQKFDAYLEFSTAKPTPTANSAMIPWKAQITYDQTLDRSQEANHRLAALLEDYRESWVKREARQHNIDAAKYQVFKIALKNVASKTEMGAFFLGLTLPIIFSVMVASGCFYPAVDTLAGERERGTWETLISTAAQRGAILVAKYLHVVTFGGLAGTLNLLAVLFTVKPLLSALSPEAGAGMNVLAAWKAMPLMIIAAVLLAGFIAGGMMIFAAFARTFKEGQAMITPFYLVLMLPIVFLQVPGLKFSSAVAWIPVVNLILMMRAGLNGTLEWLPVLLTLLSSLGVIGAMLAAATHILRFEEILTGSYAGSLFKFISARLFRRATPKEVTQ